VPTGALQQMILAGDTRGSPLDQFRTERGRRKRGGRGIGVHRLAGSPERAPGTRFPRGGTASSLPEPPDVGKGVGPPGPTPVVPLRIPPGNQSTSGAMIRAKLFRARFNRDFTVPRFTPVMSAISS